MSEPMTPDALRALVAVFAALTPQTVRVDGRPLLMVTQAERDDLCAAVEQVLKHTEWCEEQMTHCWPRNQYGSSLTPGEYKALLAEHARKDAENARLREALANIASEKHEAVESMPLGAKLQRMARAALGATAP